MTNNLDEFDQEGLDAVPNTGRQRGRLGEAWSGNPLFKLVVIMLVVGAAISIGLAFTSGPSNNDPSKLNRAPDMNEAPGGKASPFFIEQNKAAANQRAEQAMREGGSALPTPVGQSVEGDDGHKQDPLVEFRAETERLKQELQQERERNAVSQQLPPAVAQNQLQPYAMQQGMQNPQQPQQPQQFDDTLAQAMQRQLQTAMEGWNATQMKVVAGTTPLDKTGDRVAGTNTTVTPANTSPQAQQAALAQAQQTAGGQIEDKILVPAGTVNYGQMLIEANSDVPGPVLAQIVSGPFAGARAVGQFQVMKDYIVVRFNLVSFKGKDYAVDALALNPNTTLGGMATEIDQRYVDRVLLPAAASFMAAFGQAVGQGSSTVETTSSGTVTSQAKRGYKEGIFAGIGQAGQSIGQFMSEQAAQTKPLVRLAAGVPMGIFFVTSVHENGAQAGGMLGNGLMGMQGAYPNGAGAYGTTPYGANAYATVPGYGAASPQGYGYSAGGYNNAGANPYATGYNTNGYATGAPNNVMYQNGGVTVSYPGQVGYGQPTNIYGR